MITLDSNSTSVKYLCRKDKRLSKVISMVGSISYTPHNDPYVFLVHEIIEQMLSVKVGNIIFNRFNDLCNGNISVNTVSRLTDDEIRSIGTAKSKVRFIRSITDHAIKNESFFTDLIVLSDEEVYNRLISIYGIGPWTAKMYLIFVLDRQDILPIEDVAFLQSYRWLYKTNDCSEMVIRKKCNKWKPYSSIAARFLYRALDNGLTKNEFHLYK